MNELRKNRPLMIGITAVIVFLLWLAFRARIVVRQQTRRRSVPCDAGGDFAERTAPGYIAVVDCTACDPSS